MFKLILNDAMTIHASTVIIAFNIINAGYSNSKRCTILNTYYVNYIRTELTPSVFVYAGYAVCVITTRSFHMKFMLATLRSMRHNLRRIVPLVCQQIFHILSNNFSLLILYIFIPKLIL